MTVMPTGSELVEISDPADPRLTDYLHLTDVALRRVLEPAEGLYMAESSNVITRAVSAGHRPRSFLMAPRWLESMLPVIEHAGAGQYDGPPIPVFVAPEPLLEQITGFHLHRGALAAMHRPLLAPAADLIAAPGRRRIAVFENLVDHTNLGAAFRSAAALGIDGVLVTPSCADPYYRRSIRVSMGTVFQVPWTRIDWPQGIEKLHEAGYETVALALRDDSVSLDEFAGRDDDRLAIIFGTEGRGLRQSTLHRVRHVVKIPMAHGVDSLNVAAAAAVTFYALRA